jgi:hypothetical protein
LDGWVDALEQDGSGFSDIVTGWFLSAALDRRMATSASIPNRSFVRALFVDLFGRLPEDGESNRIRGALDALADSTPLRSLVARVILDSGSVPLPERASIAEPERWIGELFERMLGRWPSDLESQTFLQCYADPACRLETLIYAIVSHPEYQIW